MIRSICLLLLIVLLPYSISAQITDDDESIDDNTVISNEQTPIKEKKKFKPDGIFVGSNFSLQFGNSLFVDISPYGGYKFGKIIATGIGFTYIYSTTFSNSGTTNEQHIYGGRVFVKFRPFHKVPVLKSIYAHVEGEYLNRWDGTLNRGRQNREWIPAINVGIGFNSNFDKGFAFTGELLYNALWPSQINAGQLPVFSSPFQYRIGICYSF